MNISTVHRDSSAVVTIVGTIDVYTAGAVGETIQSLIVSGAQDIVLDFSRVTRVDSSGLGTLVGNAKSITSKGGTIWLANLTPRATKMLKITNLDRYFKIREDVDAALEELGICMPECSPS